MWDIKYNKDAYVFQVRFLFHLNHVGYKVLYDPYSFHTPFAFHLNHVGYKEGYGTSQAVNIDLSSEPCGI